MRLRELYHDIEINKEQPLKKGDVVRVFHGFNNHQEALIVAQKGLSGAQKVPRVYSYESDNNPKGLFVTGQFKIAEKFVGSYKLSVIMEFDASYEELEAPVWPGGSWTGYGQYSQYWGWGSEGRRKRNAARKDIKSKYDSDQDAPEWIKLSDDPYMADLLLNSSESQSLFVGHLNAKNIKAFYVRPIENLVYTSEWIKLSRKEFLDKYLSNIDPKHENKIKYKMFDPDESFSPELFKQRLNAKFPGAMDLDDTLSRIWQRVKNDKHKIQMFDQYFGMYFWPKQMPAAFNWFKKEFR